ncbi:hypothetical protein K438DRAFT_1988946 [Mycena galopus ATCC 62051]|nr:hypothetical protein K438DRAFT_1988946 [Mycena galopus ATCC 62051]
MALYSAHRRFNRPRRPADDPDRPPPYESHTEDPKWQIRFTVVCRPRAVRRTRCTAGPPSEQPQAGVESEATSWGSVYVRGNFLALAQLPPVFLFVSKNSSLPALLLGPGVEYKKLNYIHRWSARFIFLGPMQKEASGVAALATLCLIVLTSVAPVRQWCYAAFLVLHYLLFPALFLTICYHTIYAEPWIFPPLAFYGADIFLRILRWRIVVRRVEGKEGGMSLICSTFFFTSPRSWRSRPRLANARPESHTRRPAGARGSTSSCVRWLGEGSGRRTRPGLDASAGGYDECTLEMLALEPDATTPLPC